MVVEDELSTPRESSFRKAVRLTWETLFFPVFALWDLLSCSFRQVLTIHAAVGILVGLFIRDFAIVVCISLAWAVVCQLVYVLFESRKVNKLDSLPWHLKIARQAIMFTHDAFIAVFFGGFVVYSMRLLLKLFT